MSNTAVEGAPAASVPTPGDLAQKFAPAAPAAPAETLVSQPSAPAAGEGQAPAEKAPETPAVDPAVEAAQRAAQEANDRLNAVLAALGINQSEPPADPALTQAQQEAQASKLQLAVVRKAPAGVDVDALLDSSSFTSGLGDVNPDDHNAVAGYITKFLESHPGRFTTVAPGTGFRDTSARTNVSSGAATINDLLRAAAGRS